MRMMYVGLVPLGQSLYVPLREVLEAAVWKTPSTFASCYMKDILAAESNYGVQVLSAASSFTQT